MTPLALGIVLVAGGVRAGVPRERVVQGLPCWIVVRSCRAAYRSIAGAGEASEGRSFQIWNDSRRSTPKQQPLRVEPQAIWATRTAPRRRRASDDVRVDRGVTSSAAEHHRYSASSAFEDTFLKGHLPRGQEQAAITAIWCFTADVPDAAQTGYDSVWVNRMGTRCPKR